MGAYASHFALTGMTIVSDETHPSKPDWLTAHAAATGRE